MIPISKKSIRNSYLITSLEVKKTIRKHLTKEQVYSLIAYIVVTLLMTIGGGYLGYRAGLELRTGGELANLPVLDALHGIVSIFFLFIIVILVIRTVQLGSSETTDNLLSIARVSEITMGVFFAEIIYLLIWIIIPSVAIGVGFAVGSETFSTIITLPIATTLLGASIVSISFPLGFGLRHVIMRFKFVVKYKIHLGILIFVGYFALIVTGKLNELVVMVFEPAQAFPIGWLADLILLSAPTIEPSLPKALSALFLPFPLLLISLFASTKVAGIHWFTDPVVVEQKKETKTELETEPKGDKFFSLIFKPKTTALIKNIWLRVIRNPIKALYAAYPALILIPMLSESPPYLPLIVLVLVTWGAGMLFSLNPIGDLGNALPSVILSKVNGKEFVLAHLYATLIIGVPVSLGLTALTAYLIQIDIIKAIVLLIVTPFIILLGTIVAIGVGTTFPRFSSTKITSSTKVVIPSKTSLVIYTLYLVTAAFCGILLYEPSLREITSALLIWIIPLELTIQPTHLFYLTIILLVPIILAPLIAYRSSINKFNNYTIT
ncbi:hypothetical protein C9439_00985 [archaeon SCG-AAA382B04]|nr:hypothetical protein C9439_00985 [archaeon SCG-AAA382B04]